MIELTPERAWLQTADSAHRLQQSQLKIIAQAFTGSLPSSPDIYASVKAAWYKAMITLDKLIEGVPQDIQTPQVLLGLLAWHIYPDMNVVSGVPKHIIQNDPLVNTGGIITLGLESSSKERGISWSLPLSHLRYYGEPVLSISSLEQASSRVSFTQLLFVAFGSLTKAWCKKGETPEELDAFFVELYEYLSRNFRPVYKSQEIPKWTRLLYRAGKAYIDTNGQERSEADRLVALGRRRATSLYSEKGQDFPKAFLLSDREVYFNLLKGDNESKISWLREQLTSDTVDMKIDEALIQYRVELSCYSKRLIMPERPSEAKLHNHSGHPDWTINNTIPNSREFATLSPVHFKTVSGTTAYRR